MGDERITDRYEPLDGKAKVLVGFLVACTLLAGLAVVSDIAEYSLLSSASSGNPISAEDATASDSRQGLIGISQAVLFLITVVFWLIWFRRAYRNTWAIGATGQRFKPGWAVGSWFVPILNLFRPKQIADDIWRASDPALERGAQWNSAVPAVFHWWWFAYLASEFLYRGAGQVLLSSNPTLDQLVNASLAYIFGDALFALAGILAIQVVKKITERQSARAAALPAAEQHPVP